MQTSSNPTPVGQTCPAEFTTAALARHVVTPTILLNRHFATGTWLGHALDSFLRFGLISLILLGLSCSVLVTSLALMPIGLAHDAVVMAT